MKLTEHDLKYRNAFNIKGAEIYFKVKPKAGQKVTYMIIINDSLDSWYVKPYDKTALKDTEVVRLPKVTQMLNTTVKFNELDSIPVYKNASESSEIVAYLRRKKYQLSSVEKSMGYDINDEWFAGCNANYVKISGIGKQGKSGWIKSVNYTHK